MPKYKIAGVVFNTLDLDNNLQKYLSNYLAESDEQAQLDIAVYTQDIQREKELATVNCSDAYATGLAILRKLVEYIVQKKSGLLLHASAIKVGDDAYLFTAKSGTGKSTHAQNYKKAFGEKAVILNDDKPIIRLIDGEFYVFGSPWSGKANLNANDSAKIKGICKLERGETNSIERLPIDKAGVLILNQTVRFSREDMTDNLLQVIQQLLTKVRFYKLKCNKEIDSARLSFKAMSEGWFYED